MKNQAHQTNLKEIDANIFLPQDSVPIPRDLDVMFRLIRQAKFVNKPFDSDFIFPISILYINEILSDKAEATARSVLYTYV